ncbi:MAG TPA: NrfD/PsrC family molybdoenzyme membrane anchor subunit [Chloroflexia bacterium]|nr:NrfD/PsrC family molybdoenzyme membrane anchor subunit [Chloroflexia bacterium]
MDPNPVPAPAAPPGYYGIPPIKKPHWKWEIVLYFFLGGIASGAYTLATIAEVFGDRRHRGIVRAGRYIALVCLVASPPLLIKDLGKPSRFYNMLRVFKIKSPMSMGTWALVVFSGFAGLSAVAELAEQGVARGTWPAAVARQLPRGLIGRLGSFFALFVGGYTGVLLSATAVPLWAKNKYLLGPTFISSALSTGAAAIGLAAALTGQDDDRALHALDEAEVLALTSEIGFLAAQGVHSGRLAAPLLTGKYATLFVPGVVLGMIGPWVAGVLGLRTGHRSRGGRIVSSLLVLMSGLILRWTLVYAGKDSADDPRAYFEQSR